MDAILIWQVEILHSSLSVHGKTGMLMELKVALKKLKQTTEIKRVQSSPFLLLSGMHLFIWTVGYNQLNFVFSKWKDGKERVYRYKAGDPFFPPWKTNTQMLPKYEIWICDMSLMVIRGCITCWWQSMQTTNSFSRLGQDPKVSSLQLAKAFPAKFWPLSRGHKLTEQLRWTDTSQIRSSRSASHSRLIFHKNRNKKGKIAEKENRKKMSRFSLQLKTAISGAFCRVSSDQPELWGAEASGTWVGRRQPPPNQHLHRLGSSCPLV